MRICSELPPPPRSHSRACTVMHDSSFVLFIWMESPTPRRLCSSSKQGALTLLCVHCDIGLHVPDCSCTVMFPGAACIWLSLRQDVCQDDRCHQVPYRSFCWKSFASTQSSLNMIHLSPNTVQHGDVFSQDGVKLLASHDLDTSSYKICLQSIRHVTH